MLREIKPKNARTARILKERQPLLVENNKNALFLKSTSTSSLNNELVKDLYALKRPLAVRFTKKNPIHPFEDASSLEFFSQKNDASLLCFSSHSKKRPNNLTFVRVFDSKVLDMLECLVDPESARMMAQFGGPKARVGAKPMLSFSGPQFDDDSEGNTKFRLAKSMFIDFFRGEEVSHVDVEGLQTMISFTASESEVTGAGMKQTLHLRVWRVLTRKGEQKLPRVELEEMGPRAEFRLGRVFSADEALSREAYKHSKHSDWKTKKNIDTDSMGDKLGKIHMQRQNLNDLQTRKMRGLKRNIDEMNHFDHGGRHFEPTPYSEVGEGDGGDENNGEDTIFFINEEDKSDFDEQLTDSVSTEMGKVPADFKKRKMT